ncbi:hypothetical protein QJS10_CPA05g00858 [Acorus calamus]|uniref:Choline transporter-like protein n=1 Tax=Acorus calamus TaxID=4465 RepID=A0AAV9F019_ACOCL|nr:hypothetical protein QJS10_CPA05g00858 [Acorus calamus]
MGALEREAMDSVPEEEQEQRPGEDPVVIKESTELATDVKIQVDEPSTDLPPQTRVSRLQVHNTVTPIQVAPRSFPTPSPLPTQPLQTPQQNQSFSLNSRAYTNRISMLLFTFHIIVAIAAVCFFGFKAVQGLLITGTSEHRHEKRMIKHWLPQIEASAVLAVLLAFVWQKCVREWPRIMIHVILWSSFGFTMSAGILLICFSMPGTDGMGVALLGFGIGDGLYACWVTHRVKFASRVFVQSLLPVKKFSDLNVPTYYMLFIGFLWITVWCFGVIGALNFYYPPLTIIALILSLAWTAEVMRNVATVTVSRVVALYYLRGMQSNTQFCFQRAVTRNLGSACLGSLFVPAIEALRIVARALNLLEGEDEFLFSCAHCCLRVMEAIFRYGNSWAFVHIAAYGKDFVRASQSTWGLFEIQRMEELVDSDITSAVCFLTGVSSGAICTIFASSWTFSMYKPYTATVAMLSFFIGYLMTRIGMALPQACVSCYYVCYAENPSNRLFDSTIPDRLQMIRSGRDILSSTPRFPRRFNN